MARDEGFAVADTATSKHTDPKFRRLWRMLRDEVTMNAAVVLYEAVTLASWQHGERVAAEDAAPTWMVDVDTPTAALIGAGLLDTDARLPEKAWLAWFAPAVERRDALRERWRKANDRRRGKRGTALPPRGDIGGHIGGTATPVRPSVRPSDRTDSPSVPSDTRAARGSNGAKSPESDDERLTRYKAKAVDPSVPPGVRAAAEEEVKRLEAGRVH
jgi:hypothetical protein